MKTKLSKTIHYILTSLLIAISFFGFSFADDISKPDWNKPETIDPLNEHIGDFLDIDINAYLKQAEDAYQSGDYRQAARYYLLLARYDAYDIVSIYDLACCYGLMGETKLAAKYLERAVKAGYNDIEHIKSDADFNKVRGQKPFDDAMNNIARLIQTKQESLGKTLLINGKAIFEARIKFPKNYDPEKSYPLVIGLHGRGGNADSFITLWDSFFEPDFIYVALQGAYPVITGAEIGYSWTLGASDYSGVPDDDILMAVEYIAQTAGGIAKSYKISETYLMGFSQGATFAYLTGINFPDRFKGIFCFSGRFPAKLLTDEAVKNAAGKLRVFISHGKSEPADSYTQATTTREALKSYGYDVTFSPHDGGHEPPPPLIMYEFQRWMKEK
jgi:phospholipase/carboxylesterase